MSGFVEPRIHSCLCFDREAEEAANFYVSLFENSRIDDLMRYGPGMPLEEGLAMWVRFTLAGVAYSALNTGPMFARTGAFSFYVSCKDQAEIDRLWTALTENGGEEVQCGWLKDRFGVSWQIAPEGVASLIAHPAAMRAMLEMKKLDIAALREAARSPK